MKHRDYLLLAFGTGLVGCNPSIDNYAAEYEEAFCEQQHACHQVERKGDCAERYDFESDPNLSYLRAAVAAGTIEYDAASAAACLDAIRGRACEYDEAQDQPESCQQAFRGKIGRNGPCRISAECAGNAVCGFDPNCQDMCCEGACRVFADPLKIGEACGGSVACEDGSFCGYDPETFLSTVCTALVKTGGSCQEGQQCAPDNVCDGSKCRALELRGPGESCEGEFVDCEAPAECRSVSGTAGVVCVVEGQLGAPCGDVGCARYDTYCDAVSKLCTLLPGPGQDCAGTSCLPYAQCDGDATTTTCVPRPGAGEPCGYKDDRYIECLAPLMCLDDVCGRGPVDPKASCPVPGAG